MREKGTCGDGTFRIHAEFWTGAVQKMSLVLQWQSMTELLDDLYTQR